MPHAINHIAVSVTDIYRAMRWYRDILEMTVLVSPIEVSSPPSKPKDIEISQRIKTVFGPNFGRLLICHMSSANGVGLELFQFIEPKAERREGYTNFEYWKTGFFHIAVTDPHIEELANRIALSGGKKRTDVMEIGSGSSKKICFCEDPDGNIIEIYSHSYDQFWSNL
jgi:catechol-2,3-dioxygenase